MSHMPRRERLMAATPPVRLDRWKRKKAKGSRGRRTARFRNGTAGGKGSGGGGVTCASSMVRLAAAAIGPEGRPDTAAIGPDGRAGTAAIDPDDRAGSAAICADERLLTGWEPVGRAGGVATSSTSESSPV